MNDRQQSRADARTYITQPGESVAGIALRQCGSEDEWRNIIALNREFSEHTACDYFPVGTVLTLPPLPVSQSTASPEPCAHDYVRKDLVCTECGEKTTATPIARLQVCGDEITLSATSDQRAVLMTMHDAPIYAEPPVATSANETGAQGATVAWMHAGDPRDCISDAKKRDMIKHAGAPGARLAENYSIPLGRFGTPPTMAAAAPADERAATFEEWLASLSPQRRALIGDVRDARMGWEAARAAASPAAEAVAWVRKHPDTGALSGDWLWNDAIEQCRKDSGVWFPLGFLGAPQRAQADAPDDDRGPSGDHYRCTRCGATIAAGGKLTCERGPCPMELVPVAVPPVVRAPYQWRDTGALETGDA
ncbi:hypothetical protein [Burkholderia multivorans]|uniref:hypothetical protein n=1 Tax=Burkholderia multivorans TaxID=87883 RepID=UPI0015E2DAAA|nr:hypothetical protein [Burkholderia multivorans]